MLRLLIAKYNKDSILKIESEILPELNSYEAKRINDYNFENKAHRIAAFYLLKIQLNYFEEIFSLFEIKRDSFHKPFFKDSVFDFSISHSKNYVVCLASKSQKVGVDIEFEEQNLENIDSDFFCSAEKKSLLQQNDPELFYFLHTRKEAFSKAVGLGVFLEHKLFDAQNENLFFNDTQWYLKSLKTVKAYSLSYATNKKNTFCEILEINI